MNKDAYLQFKMREGIAHKILDKLPQTEIKDIELLPALEKFINDDDLEMFEEFRKFHDNKEIQDKVEWLERRHKQLEERKSELEEAIKRDEAYIDEAVKEYKTYMEKYKEFFKDYTTWRKCIIEQSDGIKSAFGLKWCDIKKFIADKEKKGWGNKFVYVAVGEEFHEVIGVSVDEKGKLILSAGPGSSYVINSDVPERPNLSLAVRDKYYNRIILCNDSF